MPAGNASGFGKLLLCLALAVILAGCARAPRPVALPPPLPSAPPAGVLPEPERPPEPPRAGLPEVADPRLARIDAVAKQEIAAGHVPGAVILVGRQGEIVYRKAFGLRAVNPAPQAMTPDTVFDLASLTKVVATTTAIMQLAERGRLALDRPAAAYWPEFAANGKGGITIRQLLIHTSGLRDGIDSRAAWSGYEGAVMAVAMDAPLRPPGTGFRYSDANFIALAEIVRRVSGMPLDAYCRKEIFQPLGMSDAGFKPAPAKRSRIAPTDVRWGAAQDTNAYRMGGVAGHAGLFATADDLAVFAQMLIDGGVWKGRRILNPATVAAMTTPHSIGGVVRRGLGWDFRSPYSREHNVAFPAGSFGHTGYSGTSMWIDPRSQTFLIILTNRHHPSGKGQVKTLRSRVAAIVAQSLPMGPPAAAAGEDDAALDQLASAQGQSDGPERVLTGLDVLAASGFAPLKGKRVGLITNHTGRDSSGRSLPDLLRRAPGVTIKAIFTPEHGLSGLLDEKIASGRDAASGLPIYSLYGAAKRPTPQQLQGLDALVYDIQDVGVRFYTYITTMAWCMEAAAGQGLEFYVLDRPNPLTAAFVQGPVMDPAFKSFTGYFPLPVRYGLTAGELARLFNGENRIGARLQVVKMQGYRREAWFDQTGLKWVNPSPNIRSLTQAILYPGVGLVESANVSVGRGTAFPFEVVGAPWIDGPRLTQQLAARRLSGVAFAPVTFVPAASRYQGQTCQGVRIRVTDRDSLDAPALGVEIAAALHRLYPDKFELDRTRSMMGWTALLPAIKRGADPQELRCAWQPHLDAFQRLRARYLLY